MTGRLTGYVSRAVNRLLHYSGTARLSRHSSAAVLCYHNVVPEPMAGHVGDTYLHTSRDVFVEQIDWVARKFTVVPLPELLDRLQGGRPVGGLAALTFDDGYSGVVRHAIPLMRKAGLPFSVFPVVSAVDLHRPFWWDRVGRLEASRRERYLVDLQGDHDLILAEAGPLTEVPEDLMPASWDMLRQVRGDDCTIGVHTVTHRNLTTLQAPEVRWEITHALERLQQELGAVMKVVAYPYGRTNEALQAEAARVGFAAGLNLGFRLVRRPASQLNIGRIDVPQGIDMVTFACRASGLQIRDRVSPNSRIE